MTVKTALLLLGSLLLTTGLVIGVILVSQRQLLSKKAAVPSGFASLILQPSNTSITAGETLTVTGVLNTGSIYTSGYTIKANINYSSATPPVEIVDSSSNPATTITNLLTTNLPSCPENRITHSSGQISFLITCHVQDGNTAGFNASQDVNAFSFLLKGLVVGESVSIVFDNDISLVNDLATNTDTLTFPAGSTYSIVTPAAATPTVVATPTVAPTSIPASLTTTPTLTLTPAPTSSNPQATATPAPNSCGGTCGSNANCSSNLFCDTVSGTCRNASCSTSTNCVCSSSSIAPTPTPVTQLAASGSPLLLLAGITGIILVFVSTLLLF